MVVVAAVAVMVAVLLLDVSIVSGSSNLAAAAYQSNPVQISVGDTVRRTNDYSQPRTVTVTSGVNGQPDGRFGSSIMAPDATAVIFRIQLLLKYYLVLVLFGNCPLFFLLLILLLFSFFVFRRLHD
jgi:hypothetical protein